MPSVGDVEIRDLIPVLCPGYTLSLREWAALVASHSTQKIEVPIIGQLGCSVTGRKSPSVLLYRLHQDSRLNWCYPADVSKDKSAPHPSVFGSSSSSEKTDRTLSLFTGRSGSGFDAGSIRAEEAVGASLEEIYVPEWMVTKGFEMNDGRLCANIIDHFTSSLPSLRRCPLNGA
ncbi:hypothetical protein Tco_1110515 [Tanacetum coccineum]|uniref:Uncharacterized protein n=1 Tax=Tanacetum coccineum TaxID=301880 RepID=A0ABQ5IJ34_9ASTR